MSKGSSLKPTKNDGPTDPGILTRDARRVQPEADTDAAQATKPSAKPDRQPVSPSFDETVSHLDAEQQKEITSFLKAAASGKMHPAITVSVKGEPGNLRHISESKYAADRKIMEIAEISGFKNIVEVSNNVTSLSSLHGFEIFKRVYTDGSVINFNLRLKPTRRSPKTEESPASKAHDANRNLNKETALIKVLEEFREAHGISPDGLNDLIRSLGSKTTSEPLPDKPPRLYRDRPAGEDIIAFLRQAWSPWSQTGELTRSHLRHADPQAYAALAQYLQKNPLPDDLKLPKKSEVISAQVADPAAVREARRIAQAAHRRGQTLT